MDDLISRQGAINKCRKRLYESAVNNVGYKCNADEVFVDIAENRIETWLNELPYAQPEKSTTEEKSQLAEEKSTRKLIYLDDAIDTIEAITWYHQNRNNEMVSSANSSEHQAWYKAEDVYKALEELPSAEPEIIRCENCRRRDDKWEDWEKGKVLYWCDIMDGCVKADDYCSFAERRTDEID